MSQYGAYGYAEHGKDYRFILGHYYRGRSSARSTGPRIVRVLLDISAATSASAARPAPAAKRSTAAATTRRTGPAPGVKLRSSGGQPLADCGRKLRAAGAGRVDDRRHRRLPRRARGGADRSDAGSLNAINAVPVDQYVKGVIPNESPASWPQAALRAQAVAARSFALTVQVGGNGFDLYDDTRSQVYEGLASETAATNAGRRRDQGPGPHLRRQDRRNLLLRLLRRPHREHPERLLRPLDPLPGRRPRPLRLLLPAAHLDAEVQRPGDQRQARRLPRRAR